MVSPLPTLPTICVLGSLNIDLVYYTPHHPSPGETLTSSHSDVSPGGKGANQAVACAKLSRSRSLDNASTKVVMVGTVGSDAHGSTLLDSLQSYGVDTSKVVRRQGHAEHSATGTAIVMVDERTGQNRIILTPGANASLQPESVPDFNQSKPSLLVMQLEVPLDTVLHALATAKSAGVPVLLNPAPAFQLPEEVYNGLSHLILNETEVALLAQIDEAGLADPDMVEKTALEILAKGVENLVITLGARGAYYMSKNGQKGFVPALKVDVVDTTAAGDTFIGMYSVLAVEASSCNLEFDIRAAVTKSTFASAKTVSTKGAQISIPWMDELTLE
ncbi:Ribokinase-like protein [Aureobasidium sp. EXF-12298]|jgi:ribokinase|nr:Ribokinase-like protein [Aureobasidium sp. EXF-12298]